MADRLLKAHYRHVRWPTLFAEGRFSQREQFPRRARDNPVDPSCCGHPSG